VDSRLGPGVCRCGRSALDAAGDIFTLPGEEEFSPAGVRDASVTAAPITASTPSSLGNGVSGAFAFLATEQTPSGPYWLFCATQRRDLTNLNEIPIRQGGCVVRIV
jgi:hypothetical protein